MKIITSAIAPSIVLSIISLWINTGIASHIKPVQKNAFSIPHATSFHPGSGVNGLNSGTDTGVKNKLDSKSDNALASKTKNRNRTSRSGEEKTFNQELQWRILNILAQQLFSNNSNVLTNHPFTHDRLYTTRTFAVNISSADPESFQVNITDYRFGANTKLEIPR